MSWIHDKIREGQQCDRLRALLMDIKYYLEDIDEAKAQRLVEHLKELLRDPR